METLAIEKYEACELFESLKEQIETSVLKAGDRLPGERKLSDLYGCPHSIVRKSLKKLEELKLVQRVRGSGSYVTMLSKENKSRRNIAIIVQTSKDEVDSGSDLYLTQILMGLQRDYGKHLCNFTLFVMCHEESMDSFFERNSLSAEEYDGLICFLYDLSDEDVSFIKNSSIPFATTMSSSNYQNVPHVAIDNSVGVYVATKHLLSQGRRNLYLLNGSLSYKMNQERLAGFKKALDEHDINYDHNMNIEIIPNDHKGSCEIVSGMCDNRKTSFFDGLVIYGDWATFGAFQAIKKAGLKIPNDIGVVMYDDIPWVLNVLEPSVTAVNQPFMNQAKRMLYLLLSQIDGDKYGEVETLRPELTIRESCGTILNTNYTEGVL